MKTMTLIKVIFGAVGLLIALGLLVGMVLRHYIGGFLRTVEREARREAEEREAENTRTIEEEEQ